MSVAEVQVSHRLIQCGLAIALGSRKDGSGPHLLSQGIAPIESNFQMSVDGQRGPKEKSD